jgi:hypothetical protein
VRTVQRFETGDAVQIGSRRVLAKTLGYDDQDIFDDPKFAATVLSCIEECSSRTDKETLESLSVNANALAADKRRLLHREGCSLQFQTQWSFLTLHRN